MHAHTHACMHLGLELGEFRVLKLSMSGPGAECTSLGMNGQILVCSWWVGERDQELHDWTLVWRQVELNASFMFLGKVSVLLD